MGCCSSSDGAVQPYERGERIGQSDGLNGVVINGNASYTGAQGKDERPGGIAAQQRRREEEEAIVPVIDLSNFERPWSSLLENDEINTLDLSNFKKHDELHAALLSYGHLEFVKPLIDKIDMEEDISFPMQFVCHLLQHNSSLTSLYSNHNKLKPEQTSMLLQCLIDAPLNLRLLSINRNKLSSIHAPLLAQLPSIRNLDISYCDLHDDGIVAICDALSQITAYNSRLQILNLCGNEFKDIGLEAVGALLDSKSRISQLSISSNSFSQSAAEVFVNNTVSRHHGLTELHCFRTTIRRKLLATVRKRCRANRVALGLEQPEEDEEEQGGEVKRNGHTEEQKHQSQ